MAHTGGQLDIDIVSFAFGTYGQYDIERPIYIDASNESTSITAHQALTLVKQLVAGFKQLGLETGDCICLHAANNVLYAPLWLGAIGAGGVVSGVNPAYTVPELVHHLTITNTKYIIAQEDHLPNISEAAKQCGIPEARIFALGLCDERRERSAIYQSWKVLLSFGEMDWRKLDHEEEQKSAIAVLGSTSGTTGLPKAAKLSHHYLVAQSTMIQAGKRGASHEITQLVCLPVFHAFAAQLSLVLPLREGTLTYFMPKFKLPDFVEVVKKFQITDVAVVPPIITALLRLDDEYICYLRSLRYVLCAGAPIDAEIQDKFYRAINPDGIVAQVWGTTETGWVTAFGSAEKDSSGSVGRALAGVEIKILDEHHCALADGIPGEACVRTPSMFNGYLGSSISTKSELDEEGYYHTGDQAYLRQGKVFIDGRIKDIMKVNGWQVSPAELEAIILQHPDVIDAVVVGKDRINNDGLKETRPQAFVVRRQRAGVDQPMIAEEDVQNFVAARVVTYKRLTGGVVFVDKIARNSTGKVQRRLLQSSSSEDDDVATVVGEMLSKTQLCQKELIGPEQKLASAL